MDDPRASTLEGRPGERARILVVAADPGERETLAVLLASNGYEPVGVPDAARGLCAVDELPSDLVLYRPAPGDGSAFCRALRTGAHRGWIPVVLVSGDTGEQAVAAAFAAGADDVAPWPLDRPALLLRIHTLLRLGRQRRAYVRLRDAAEQRRLQALRATFERYVSPKLVDRILAAPALQDLLLTQQSRCVAVMLFADLRDFTRVSELLAPPQVVRLLDEFFTMLTQVAHRHDGTVLNMSGDCLLVVFGVPLPQDDAATRALAAARAMLQAFGPLAAGWNARHAVTVGLGIGINRGEVVAGNVGSPSYMSYTVIGDAVNVAARLMQRARAGEFLFTQSVLEAPRAAAEVPDVIALPPLDLKGKADPLRAYAVHVLDRLPWNPAAAESPAPHTV